MVCYLAIVNLIVQLQRFFDWIITWFYLSMTTYCHFFVYIWSTCSLEDFRYIVELDNPACIACFIILHQILFTVSCLMVVVEVLVSSWGAASFFFFFFDTGGVASLWNWQWFLAQHFSFFQIPTCSNTRWHIVCCFKLKENIEHSLLDGGHYCSSLHNTSRTPWHWHKQKAVSPNTMVATASCLPVGHPFGSYSSNSFTHVLQFRRFSIV